MKTTVPFLFSLLMFVWTVPLAAQHHGAHGPGQDSPMDSTQKGDMMKGGMMHSMCGQMMEKRMSDPLSFSTMLIPVLPTMKDPLALSDEQVALLKESATTYQDRQREISDQIAKAESQIQDLLSLNEPDPIQLKTLLRDAAMHGADLKAAGFETALKMKGQLSAEQRAKLEGMSPMKLHRHMMANMTMMGMMQAMQCDKMMGGMKMGHEADNMPEKMEMTKPHGMMN